MKKMEFLLLTETSSWLLLSLMKVCTYVFVRVLNFFFNGRKVLVNDIDDDQKNAAVLLGNVKADDYKQNISSNDEGEICMEELITVMDRLGLVLLMETAGEKGEENWGKKSYSVNEFEATLFDDEDQQEPSLLEIKEAFDVFDNNKDGYIDAAELQRILRILYNIKEGEEAEEYELEKCREMLCVFDENGDGLIDFPEFVKFMGETLMK